MQALAISPGLLPLFALTLTVGSYLLGVEIQKRAQHPLANPVLIAIILIGVTLRFTHTSYSSYFSGAQFIHFLLGPATVALAIPLVRSLEHMRRLLVPMFTALIAGSILSMTAGYLIVRALGGPRLLALSMLPKACTTPIAIGIATRIGGDPSLTAVLAIAGGILVAICIDPITKALNLHDPAARGLAAGAAGSGIGASRVIPRHTISAAFAGVAIGLNGLITAMLAPLFVEILKRF